MCVLQVICEYMCELLRVHLVEEEIPSGVLSFLPVYGILDAITEKSHRRLKSCGNMSERKLSELI